MEHETELTCKNKNFSAISRTLSWVGGHSSRYGSHLYPSSLSSQTFSHTIQHPIHWQANRREVTYLLLCAGICAQSLQCSLPDSPVLNKNRGFHHMHTHKLTQTTKSTCTRGLSECHMVRYSPFHSLSISNSSNAISVAIDTEDKRESDLETLLRSRLWPLTIW